MKKQSIITMIGILAMISFIIFLIARANSQPGEYDDFAKCLTEKGAKMYGTSWCPHCKDQKALFGKSFKLADYIDCDYNKDECNAEGIKGYPTWKINGESYPGTQQLEALSQLTDCEIK